MSNQSTNLPKPAKHGQYWRKHSLHPQYSWGLCQTLRTNVSERKKPLLKIPLHYFNYMWHSMVYLLIHQTNMLNFKGHYWYQDFSMYHLKLCITITPARPLLALSTFIIWNLCVMSAGLAGRRERPDTKRMNSILSSLVNSARISHSHWIRWWLSSMSRYLIHKCINHRFYQSSNLTVH